MWELCAEKSSIVGIKEITGEKDKYTFQPEIKKKKNLRTPRVQKGTEERNFSFSFSQYKGHDWATFSPELLLNYIPMKFWPGSFP